MATIANLNILLTMEDHATKTLSKAQRDLNQIGKSMQQWGAGLTAAVTVPVIAGAAAIVKMASDQQEAINAVNEVYGDAADTVLAFGDAAAQSMGLATAEYLSAAAVFGVYSTAAGLAGQEAAEFANSNLQLAADLGSFFNASTEEVTGALQAAYRGEFDALDRYGIMLNVATLEQFALAEGIWDGNDAMTTQQRILATNAYMQQRAGAATGDFARTSNSLANSQKILRAQIKDVGAQLGNVLLPTVTKVVAIFRELLTRFQGLPESWQRWIVLIALAAAAIGPLLIVLGTLLTVLPAIGAALAVLTGPIGLVIAAIALLTAAYIGNWWGFRDAVDGVAGSVASLLGWLNEFTFVNSVVESAVNAISGLLDRLGGAFTKTGDGIMSGNWRKAIAGIGDLLAAPAKAIGEFIRGIETGFAPLDALLDGVGGYFVDMGRVIQEVFQGDLRGALSVFTRLLLRMPTTILNIFRTIDWSGVGETLRAGFAALPGFIADSSTALYQKGRDLLKGVVSGLNDEMATVTAWLGLVGTIAGDAVGSLADTLVDKGEELIVGILTGLNTKFSEVTAWLGLIDDIAAVAVDSLGDTLYAHGADLIGGLLGGINYMWTYVIEKLASVPGMAVEQVGSLGATLYSAGADLIGGFIGGIQSMISSVESVLTGLTNRLVGWKGPPARDAMLLFNNGTLIMRGLIDGIESQVPALRRTLGDITTDINGGMSARLDAAAMYAPAMAAASGINMGAQDGGNGMGGNRVLNIYGQYYEADRQWEPENTLNSYAIARSRG